MMRIIGNAPIYRKRYDSNFDQGHIIEHFADQIFLYYQKTKGAFMISPRDYILLVSSLVKPDGTIYQLANSEEDLQDTFPVEKGVIRSFIPVKNQFLY